MPNAIKYSTDTQTLALKKGNYWIGTGDVGKGPTSSTDYWNGITPPTGGYTIYLNKASNGPSIYTPSNDSQLITITNRIAGASYTTINECFNYFNGQSDKMVVNRDVEGIVTDGLQLYLDAGFLPSYPQNGTTWTDLSGNGDTCTLTNGPTFNSSNGGSIVIDSVDDYVVSTSTSNTNINSTTGYTFGAWVYPTFTATELNDRQIQSVVCSRANSTATNDYTIAFGLVSNSLGCGVYQDRKLYLNNVGNNLCSANKFDWTNNAWQYIVVTQVGTGAGSVNMYVNGTNVLSSTGFIVSGNATNKYFFGQSLNTNQVKYNGRIAINHVYNRALSASEVLQNYNAQNGRFAV